MTRNSPRLWDRIAAAVAEAVRRRSPLRRAVHAPATITREARAAQMQAEHDARRRAEAER